MSTTERLEYLKAATRYPKLEHRAVSAPTYQCSHEEWNEMVECLDEMNTLVDGTVVEGSTTYNDF